MAVGMENLKLYFLNKNEMKWKANGYFCLSQLEFNLTRLAFLTNPQSFVLYHFY